MKKGNIFSEVTITPHPIEYYEDLHVKSGTMIQRIVSFGFVSPPGFWYDQDDWEYVIVLQGSAELETETEKIPMNPGDWVIIPEHERHRVSYTSSEPPCVWLAVYGGRQ